LFWLITGGVILIAISQFPDKFQNANDAYAAGDYTEAMRLWRELAEKGDANAQHNVGSLYKNGKGVEEDDDEAAKWFEQAAAGGNAASQFEIGKLIETGVAGIGGTPAALAWILKAANQGYPLALADLGIRHMTGDGVAIDPVKAVFWLDQLTGDGRNSPIIYSDHLNDLGHALPCKDTS